MVTVANRVRWVRRGASTDTPKAADVWELDGFLVFEKDGKMTVLDGDLWPRKVSREPSPGWTGGVANLDLKRVATLAIGRLRAIKSDPGAVEGMDEIYRGIRLRFGDEGQSLAFARHCAMLANARFARSGDPNHPGLPVWPAYDEETRATMFFQIPPRIVEKPQEAVRIEWEKIVRNC